MDSLFGGCWDVIKHSESEDDVTDGGEGKREGEAKWKRMGDIANQNDTKKKRHRSYNEGKCVR